MRNIPLGCGYDPNAGQGVCVSNYETCSGSNVSSACSGGECYVGNLCSSKQYNYLICSCRVTDGVCRVNFAPRTAQGAACLTCFARTLFAKHPTG